MFDSAGKSVEAVANEQADVGFFAVDPKRGEAIAFTKPYVLIEGSYLVREAFAAARRTPRWTRRAATSSWASAAPTTCT